VNITVHCDWLLRQLSWYSALTQSVNCDWLPGWW